MTQKNRVWADVTPRSFLRTQVSSIRLLNGPDGRPKGFGYVEFETQDALKAALDATGSDVGGRQIRVTVADPRRYPDLRWIFALIAEFCWDPWYQPEREAEADSKEKRGVCLQLAGGEKAPCLLI